MSEYIMKGTSNGWGAYVGELIRCKDCKYWDVSKSNIMNHTCHWGYFLKKEDDYCSWAKPKNAVKDALNDDGKKTE